MQLSYESAKDVVLEGVHSELQEIFNYDPSIKRCREDDSHPMRLQGITRAFEILLCHYKDEDNPEKIQQTLMKKVHNCQVYFDIYKLQYFPSSFKVKIKNI